MRLAILVVFLSVLPAAAQASDGGVLVAPRLLTDSPARYPADAGALFTSPVEVTLELTIDEAGEVSSAEVIEEEGPAPALLATAALHAAIRLSFSPATLDGRPRAVRVRFSYLFQPPQAVALEGPPRAVLTGVVRSRGYRQPVPFATLTSDDGATTTTDESGTFRLELEPGKRRLQLQAPAFVPDGFDELLEENKLVSVVYTLLPRQVNPYETVVRADRQRTEVARVELHAAEVREVPGTFGDPFRVVMLLPGVAAIASGVSYPVVRGSSPASTGYFLDGVRVPQLFHVFLGPAIIHPDFIEGVDFFAGAAPVRYGRLLGGVVEGRLSRPRTEGLKASAYVDLINAGLLVELPIAATDTSLTVGARLSYTALMIAAATAAIAVPNSPKLVANFWDYQARVEQGLLGGKLRLFVFGSGDVFGTDVNPLDKDALFTTQTVEFHRVDLRYRHALGLGEVELAFTFGDDVISLSSTVPLFAMTPLDVVQGQLGIVEGSTTIYQRTFGGRASWTAELNDEWAATLGVTVESVNAGFRQWSRTTLDALPDSPREVEHVDPAGRATISSASFELPWRPRQVGGLRLVPGVRFDHWSLRPDYTTSSLDPRVAAFWDASDALELHASVGWYHQAPTFLINLPVIDVASVRLGLQSAVQTSVGAKVKVWRDLELSADAYVNLITRSVEVGIFDDEQIDTRDLDPNRPPRASARPKYGQAWGVEAMLRWPQKGHFFGWLTASISRSQRHLTFQRLNAQGRNLGNEVADLPYAFDQTFIANMVLSYRFDNGISVGATLHFNTGRPESGELTSRTQVPVDTTLGPRWVRVSRDQAERLPAYFRLDLRLAKTWLTERFSIEVYLDVLNVLVRQEVLGYSYTIAADGKLERVPSSVPIIIPNLGVRFRY